jgi:hypothetical protein
MTILQEPSIDHLDFSPTEARPTVTITAPPQMTPVQRILLDARHLIEKGWIRGAMEEDGKFCSIGAIYKVRGVEMSMSTIVEDLDPLTKSAIETVSEVVDDECFHRDCGVSCKSSVVVGWNDRPGRTQEEVVAAFTRAIEVAG